jgi:hypothetical protein
MDEVSLYAQLENYLKFFGTRTVGPLLANDTLDILLYENDKVRIVKGTWGDYTTYDNYFDFELIDKRTGIRVLYRDGKQKHDIIAHPDLEFLMPYLEEMLDIFNIEVGDFIVVLPSTTDAVYKCVAKTSGGVYRYVPIGSERVGKKKGSFGWLGYSGNVRKATKSELQAHFDRWKQLADQLGLT